MEAKSKDSSRREASEKAFATRKAEGRDCRSSRSQFVESGAEVYAKALLYFNELHISTSARNSNGLYLTSMWVAPSWNPKAQVADLESYRQVARDIVAVRKDPNLHLVEGPDLIDHDIALFDATPVHPNDKGFAQMGERLATQMLTPSK